MEKSAMTAVVALGVAAPAFAQTQLERSVGAEAFQYTLSELARLHFSQDDSGSEARVFFNPGSERYSTSGRHNARAQQILNQIAEENRGDN
jgi:hypothetical protein